MKPSTTVIPIEGMRCAGCANTIEKKLQEVRSVDWASVNFANKKAFVRGSASVRDLIKAIEAAGYRVRLENIQSPELELAEMKRQKLETFLALLFSTPVFFLSMLHLHQSWSPWIQLICSIPVFYLGRKFFLGAWNNLRHKSFTMDSLVEIGRAHV